MPKYIRVSLTPAQRDELNQRARQRVLAPALRERLEMVRLSDLGWRIPQITQALGRHHQTVRKYLKAFLQDGFAALPDRPRPGRPPKLTAGGWAVLERLLDESAQTGRTWTVPALVAWLATEHGVQISAGRLAVVLQTHRFRWKRTKRSLHHKRQNPLLQERKVAELETLIL